MAMLKSFSCVTTFTLLVFCFSVSGIPAADESFSSSLKWFGKESSFGENIALYGDAKVVNGGSSIQLTDSVSSSAGRAVYKKLIRLFEGKERNLVSFSTYFSFSMSNESGEGLAFVIIPSRLNLSLFGSDSSIGFPVESVKNGTEVVGVKFDTSKDVRYGESNKNHFRIDVRSIVFAKTSNFSSVSNMALNNGEKLRCWIDYEASSKRFEVRLSKSGETKPVYPVISYSIDLSRMWKDENLFVGLSSSNGNSSQTCFIYSWSFKLRYFPHWMHSQPFDPKEINKTDKHLVVQKRSDRLWRMIGSLILGAACGTLGAFLVLYVCTVCGSRRPVVVVPEECAAKSVGLEHKKVEVVVMDNATESEGKN